LLNGIEIAQNTIFPVLALFSCLFQKKKYDTKTFISSIVVCKAEGKSNSANIIRRYHLRLLPITWESGIELNNMKYIYAFLMALVAVCFLMLPVLAQDMANKHDPTDKSQLSDFDRMSSNGSFDWMLPLDNASLDNLTKMKPDEIDKLRQDMIQKIKNLPPEELDRLRNLKMHDLGDRLRDLPPEELDRLRPPMPGDMNPRFNDSKIDDHKPVDNKSTDNRNGDPFQSGHREGGPDAGPNSFNNQPGGQMGRR
jgi:hypothetical protein